MNGSPAFRDPGQLQPLWTTSFMWEPEWVTFTAWNGKQDDWSGQKISTRISRAFIPFMGILKLPLSAENVYSGHREAGSTMWLHWIGIPEKYCGVIRDYGEWSGYNPGNLIKLASRNIFVTFSAYHLMGFDTETGEMLWSHEQESYPPEERKPGYGDTHANAILYDNGSLYYVAGDGNCGVRLDLSGDGTSITEVWRNKDFDGFMGGIVKIDNILFSTGTSTRYLKSLDATTGQLIDSLKIGQGAVISADGMIYYYNQQGQMKLINNDQGRLQEVSSFEIITGNRSPFFTSCHSPGCALSAPRTGPYCIPYPKRSVIMVRVACFLFFFVTFGE